MNIVISGVGGQGTILASKILAEAALIEGFSPRTGETIGMSQRGGSVTSHVRTDGANSSYIQKGGADLLIGFELCEAARNLGMLSPNGKAIVNTKTIKSVVVSLGKAEYDAEAMKTYLADNTESYFLDAASIAATFGSEKATNILLLGVAYGAGFLDVSRESLEQAIKANVKSKFLDMNLAAFERGIFEGERLVKEGNTNDL